MKKKLLDDRYRFTSAQNLVGMSEKSMVAKRNFIGKYKGEDLLVDQPCYICEGCDWTLISEIDRYGFFYPTSLCGTCGNVQQSRYYKSAILQDFYQNFYREIYGSPTPEQLFEKQRTGRGPVIWDFVTEDRVPETVLEMGCGAAGILSVFKDHGCSVLGFDYDDNFLEIARTNQIPVVLGSLDQLNRAQKFDLIILSHVLEHVTYPVDVLRKLKDHLTPTGIVYIEVPSLENIRNGGYRHDLLRYFQNAHVTHYTTQTLRLVCNKAGLSPVKSTDFIHSCWQTGEISLVPFALKAEASVKYSSQLLAEIEGRRIRKSAAIISARAFGRRKVLSALNFLGIKGLVTKVYWKLKSR